MATETETAVPAALQPGEAAVPAGELVALGLLAERWQQALAAAVARMEAAERGRDEAKAELAALENRLGAAIAASVKTERGRAEAAEAKAAAYENGITWETTCLSCARVLDSSIAETFRREQAEEKLADAGQAIANFLGQYGRSEIPMFKVGIDLANSLRKILGGDTGERLREDAASFAAGAASLDVEGFTSRTLAAIGMPVDPEPGTEHEEPPVAGQEGGRA